MEKHSFDFGTLFNTHEKKQTEKSHPRSKMANSVKGGIEKRLQISMQHRKSSRLTGFDSVRQLPGSSSPVQVKPISEAQKKMEHRRQQLEKFKIEKERLKKQMIAEKKKPFITGIAKSTKKYEPPPPPPPKPSTSGRVTRSMARANVKESIKIGAKDSTFAPTNKKFRPVLKISIKTQKLAPPSKTKSKAACTFEPVVYTAARTKGVLTRQDATESEGTWSKTKKSTPKKTLQSSSSSSDLEPTEVKNRTPKKPSFEPKQLTLQSSSDDNSCTAAPKRKSLRSTYAAKDSEYSSSNNSTDMEPLREEPAMEVTKSRKSLPKNFSPRPLPSTSSSDRISSDVEFIDEIRPALSNSRKSLLSTPKNHIPKSESRSEERLRSPKSPCNLELTPEKIEGAKNTPTVTMSRGKDNARKEAMWKMKEGFLDDDASDIDSVEYFRKQLASEVARISDLCNTWDKIFGQAVLPEFVQEAILAAVGQGRLLVSQKLQQFGSLVERCARPDPRAALVTPADLRGFWDMVFIQVTNVDLRFKKLEELKLRNWVEEAPVTVMKTAAKSIKGPAKRTRPVAGSSGVRQMMAERRKAIKQQQQNQSSTKQSSIEAEKSFEAGFFTVRSPVRSPAKAPSTPSNKHNLLKAVLSSEAKKASRSPFAMLRASKLAKSVEQDGVAPLPLTPQTNANLFATPGRSILKSKNLDTSKSGKKSIKVVIFNATDSDDSEPITFFDNHNTSDTYPTAVDEDLINFDNTIENLDKENTPCTSMKTRRQSKRHAINRNEATPTAVDEDLINIDSVENLGKINTPTSIIRTRRQSRLAMNATETEPTPIRSSKKNTVVSKVSEDTKNKKNKESDTHNVVQKTTRSTRKKTLQDNGDNIPQENMLTPKRSSRRNNASTSYLSS